MTPLSPDLFAKLTGEPVPEPGGGGERPSERRQYGRVRLGRRAQVRVGDGPWRTVLVRDMSVVGVGFQSDGRLEPGERFTLRLEAVGGGTTCLPCVVHRCEAGGVGGVAFFVGSTFGGEAGCPTAAQDEPAGRRSLFLRIGRHVWARRLRGSHAAGPD